LKPSHTYRSIKHLRGISLIALTAIIGRNAAPADKASGFLLSMLSPVWRAKLCGDIGGEARWQLALDGTEVGLFRQLVALGSGAAVMMDGLGGVIWGWV
jgi:hypothetical protein